MIDRLPRTRSCREDIRPRQPHRVTDEDLVMAALSCVGFTVLLLPALYSIAMLWRAYF